MTVSVGYFGKIPARGDFLRWNVPDNAVALLDSWIARNLGQQQNRHGEAFDLAWERAPLWRFSLDVGRLDPACAASGLWMPSIDRAGRCFPLILLALHPPKQSVDDLLNDLQPVMRDLVQFDQPPEMLQAAIETTPPPLSNSGRPPGDLWLRPALHDGSPVVLRAALPDGEGFELLLRLLPQELSPSASV